MSSPYEWLAFLKLCCKLKRCSGCISWLYWSWNNAIQKLLVALALVLTMWCWSGYWIESSCSLAAHQNFNKSVYCLRLLCSNSIYLLPKRCCYAVIIRKESTISTSSRKLYELGGKTTELTWVWSLMALFLLARRHFFECGMSVLVYLILSTKSIVDTGIWVSLNHFTSYFAKEKLDQFCFVANKWWFNLCQAVYWDNETFHQTGWIDIIHFSICLKLCLSIQ